jgi:hypothetical protein
MTTVELLQVAGAILQVKLGRPVQIEYVGPVDVEMRPASAAAAAASGAGGGGGAVIAAHTAAAAADHLSSSFEKAYLCLGRDALWFVDPQLTGLMRPHALGGAHHSHSGGVPYREIDCVEVQAKAECAQTFCVVVKGTVVPSRVYVRAAERGKAVSQLQLFWSISHVQTKWFLPGSGNVVVKRDVMMGKHGNKWPPPAAPPSVIISNGNNANAANNTATNMNSSSSSSGGGKNQHERVERLGEYRFRVPAWSEADQAASAAWLKSLAATSSPSLLKVAAAAAKLPCTHLMRVSQHYNRVTYSSVPLGGGAGGGGGSGGGGGGSTEGDVFSAWLLEIATLPPVNIDHDSCVNGECRGNRLPLRLLPPNPPTAAACMPVAHRHHQHHRQP